MKKIKIFKTYEITDLKDMFLKSTEKNKNRVAFKLKDSNRKNIYKIIF